MSIKVEVFSSPGCSKCGQAKEVLRKLAEEIGGGRIEWREVNVLDELDYAVNLGVLSTPAIVIDGQLTFTGLPSVRKLRSELDRRLAVQGGAGTA
ncbi:MAG: glutaredoxin [Gammaproteobacteria bacterium]|nr:glutaredoxin [Gammaproteobacteria bacterium]NIR28864.1 glutaredoxin [Gammaproteobacteria bacterium]NIR97245.1 glutaredoxin [Gammaproteobacteria bacterium]NIT62956.1 glutaredoxin [Gammaproteobacteria bacterium]NIV20646.1 glutaredoxin [Gammaproteobacteria bacterium]